MSAMAWKSQEVCNALEITFRSGMYAKWFYQPAFQILWSQWKQIYIMNVHVSLQDCKVVVATTWLDQIESAVTYCCIRCLKFKSSLVKRRAWHTALFARSCQYVVCGMQSTRGPNLFPDIVDSHRRLRVVPMRAFCQSTTHVPLKWGCAMSGCLPLHVLCICGAGGSTWCERRR